MQGDRVEQSVIATLDAINRTHALWDGVVIIRGGGANSDLSGFDTYLLAANCAQFPLPIITGIGHERDDTVLDMIAHTRVKTPTAAAEYLISRIHEEALHFQELADMILARIVDRMGEEKLRISRLAERLPSLFAYRRMGEERRIHSLYQRLQVAASTQLTKERYHLATREQQLTTTIRERIRGEQYRLQLLEKRIENADVFALLKRGFTLTLKEGQIVKDPSLLQPGDILTTRFAMGEEK